MFSLGLVKVYMAPRLVSVSNEILSIFTELFGADGRPEKTLSQESSASIGDALNKMAAELDELGLWMTKKAADRWLGEVAKTKTVEDCWSDFHGLNSRFLDEVDGIKFFYVPPDKLRFYTGKAPLTDMEGVEIAFPSAAYDLREAGNCFALDRFTAAVMHSMRALEVGLKAVARSLGVSRSVKGWGKDLSSSACP